jgi:NADPH:quinone reductase-like Zn-dependent oxidoreductase
VVRIEDAETPMPKDNEVLIKVRAASVNPLDAGLMKGKPHSFRILFGLRKPRLTRPGVDVAGQVEAVGRNVTEFKPGHEVFASGQGTNSAGPEGLD